MEDFVTNIKTKIKDFTEDKGRLFGFLYPYILFVGLAIGLIYISNLGEIERQSIPPMLHDTITTRQLRILEPKTVGAVDIMELSESSADLTAKGKALYEANCASCHGVGGRGDGPASQGLNPPPRNFLIKEGWVHGPKISQIYETLENGILGTSMLPFDYLAPEDKFALAHYIRETFVPDPPEDSQSDLQNLDMTYNLSQDRELPGKVPVEIAMDLIIRDNKQKIDKINQVEEKISQDNSEGAVIFKKIIEDKGTALSTFITSTDWKSGRKSFINHIVNNVNQNGFSDKVFFLSDSEWNSLYDYVNKIL